MKRRIAREAAMRALYQIDLSKCSIDSALKFVFDEAYDLEMADSTQNFARELATGTLENLGQIDMVIANLAKDWSINRMSPVDRNIIRVAAYELMFPSGSTPMATAINEALEIAKNYGDYDSPKFVNGILGKLADSLKTDEGGV